LVWYKNLIGVAHANSLQCYPSYITPQGDTLVINANLYNPENHPVNVYANVSGFQSAFTDTIQLYDDGLHNDNLASDNIWGNSKWLNGLARDFYQVSISTHDLTVNDVNTPEPAVQFTTIGPVVFDDYTITSSDTVPNPGERIKFEINLKNKDTAAIAEKITCKISELDTVVSMGDLLINFGDISPGEIKTGENKQNIRFSDNCPGNMDVYFKVKIFSDVHLFWQDTFSVFVHEAVGMAENQPSIPKEFALKQNYPNPFNPKTIISYQLPASSEIELSIYNLLGQKVQTLVSEKQPAGTYKMEWDARGQSTGIYFCHLKTDQGYSKVRKLILIK